MLTVKEVLAMKGKVSLALVEFYISNLLLGISKHIQVENFLQVPGVSSECVAARLGRSN